MGTKEKSTKASSGRAFSGDDDLVVPKGDRTPSDAGAQANIVLESAAHASLRMALDGEAERGLFGFIARTETRVLFVPYTRAASVAEAILLCQRHGFISEKLAQMNETAASITYFTTIIPPPSPS